MSRGHQATTPAAAASRNAMRSFELFAYPGVGGISSLGAKTREGSGTESQSNTV